MSDHSHHRDPMRTLRNGLVFFAAFFIVFDIVAAGLFWLTAALHWLPREDFNMIMLLPMVTGIIFGIPNLLFGVWALRWIRGRELSEIMQKWRKAPMYVAGTSFACALAFNYRNGLFVCVLSAALAYALSFLYFMALYSRVYVRKVEIGR